MDAISKALQPTQKVSSGRPSFELVNDCSERVSICMFDWFRQDGLWHVLAICHVWSRVATDCADCFEEHVTADCFKSADHGARVAGTNQLMAI